MQKIKQRDLADGYTLGRWFRSIRENGKNKRINHLRLNLIVFGLFLVFMVLIPFGLLEDIDGYRANRMLNMACLVTFLGSSLILRHLVEKEKIGFFLKPSANTKKHNQSGDDNSE
jgi:hypothetical protein